MTPSSPTNSSDVYAPGTTVKIRDEEWLIESARQEGGMTWLEVRGLRGLVQDTVATFSPELDEVERVSPADTKVVADDSPRYRRSRLWLEATLRKSPEPLRSTAITVARDGMIDALDYQLEAVDKALSEDNPRCRILLADAVGLGKTIEIGMILSELIKRGKGERILVVTPRHVLEQTQLELWTRFALPFVRLDSAGIQKVRQKIPANRNPFTYYPRAIVSIDTLKSDLYVHQIAKQRWDAVVIDESHNLSNSQTLNNRLARVLAKNTDALILASATPHNGKAESFAELIRLLDPTAVTPDGTLIPEEVEKLVIRRHRHSDSVAQEVGTDWAERKDPIPIPVEPNQAEDAIATELSRVWMHPEDGRRPMGDVKGAEALFPWTLAKAFLSSPAALLDTVQGRRERGHNTRTLTPEEDAALERLEDLTNVALEEPSAKFEALVHYLKQIGVGKDSDTRAVVFAERVATLKWLREKLPKALGMPDKAFEIMYGGLDDMEQQRVVDEFARERSDVRVLITGDVASEGVNLHRQCHNLIHYELPWSLIRIEQRNGRIDRYGQKHSPQIAMMVMEPSDPNFSGDVRILSSLMEKEHEAHKALGQASSLMGEYSQTREEEQIRQVLAGQKNLDDVVRSVEDIEEGDEDDLEAFLASILNGGPQEPETAPKTGNLFEGNLYEEEVDFLQDALAEAFDSPTDSPDQGGVNFKYDAPHGIAQFTPPRDLIQRMNSLPQAYLKDRRVTENVVLATNKERGEDRLRAARADSTTSSWPDASYLAPLHPVLEWATDRALASLGRGQIFAVRGTVDNPTVLTLATLLNASGSVSAASWVGLEFPDLESPDFAFTHPYQSAQEALDDLGLDKETANPGPVADTDLLNTLIPEAVAKAGSWSQTVFGEIQRQAQSEQETWDRKAREWGEGASALVQRKELKEHHEAVREQREYIETLAPSRPLVRPILVVVPESWEVAR